MHTRVARQCRECWIAAVWQVSCMSCHCQNMCWGGGEARSSTLDLVVALAQAAREERRARERAERAARGEDEDEEPVARIVAYSDRCARARRQKSN